MILTGQVVAVEHGEKFTDGRDRATIKFAEADATFSEIRLPRRDLNLGDLLRFVLETDHLTVVGKAASMTLAEAHRQLSAAYPSMSNSVHMGSWHYCHDMPKPHTNMEIQFTVFVNKSLDLCETFSGNSIADAVAQAVAAANNKNAASPDEAEAIAAEAQAVP